MAGLRVAEKAFSVREQRFRERQRRLVERIPIWQEEARQRGRQELAVERAALEREAESLEALRDEIASVGADE